MKSVQFDSYTRLGCSCGSDVIFCVDEDLTSTGLPFIEGTIVSIDTSTDSTGRTVYSYIFSFEDGALADPNHILLTCEITGAFCETCLTTWVRALIPAPVPPSPEDWHILGNTGTIDGTNFLGTIDNVAHDIRVNNRRSRRTVPQWEYLAEAWDDSIALFESGPQIIDGVRHNTISSGETGSAILSGGYWYPYDSQSPQRNQKNEITSFTGTPELTMPTCNLICGGFDNRISDTNGLEGKLIANVLTGGEYNSISTEDYPVDPYYGWRWAFYNTVSGGWTNGVFGSNAANAIAGGNYNWIMSAVDWNATGLALAPAFTSFIGAGGVNKILGAESSSIVGGYENEIFNAYAALIGGGTFNVIGQEDLLTDPTTIQTTSFCVIGGGQRHFIDFVESSGIFTGHSNEIAGITDKDPTDLRNCCTILGGFFNKIQPYNTNNAIQGLSSILGGMDLFLGARSIGFQLGNTPPDSFIVPARTFTDLTAFYDIFYCGDADLWIGNIKNAARKLKFFEPNTSVTYTGTNYSSFEAQAQGANIEYKLPAAAGVAGQVLKIQGVAGTVVTLEWANDLT